MNFNGKKMNVKAEFSVPECTVLYKSQDLTPEQQAQARKNIGVPGCNTEDGGAVFGDLENNQAGTSAAAFGEKIDASGVPDDEAEWDRNYWRHNEAHGKASMVAGMGSVSFSRASKALGYRTQTGYPTEAMKQDYPTELGYIHAPATLSEEDKVRVEEGTYGQAAVAIGSDTLAAEHNSFAGGYKSQALGKNAFAFGNGAVAKEADSFAVGEFASALEDQVVLGRFNSDDRNAVLIVGHGTSQSNRRNAFTVDKEGNVVVSGYLNVASGGFVVNPGGTVLVEGSFTASNGLFNVDGNGNVSAVGLNASGNATIKGSVDISGKTKLNSDLQVGNTYPFKVNASNGAVSAGNQSETAAAYAFAFGTWDSTSKTPTKAAGQGSFATGQASQALALAAFSAGRFTKAAKSYSSAFGLNTETGRDAQTVVGQFNTVKDNALFVVGNGTSTKPSNALEVDTAGNTTIFGQLKFGSIDEESARKVRHISKAFETPDATTPGAFDGHICIQTDGISATVWMWSSDIQKWIKLGSATAD